MSRRAPRSRNTLRTARLLTCFLAASALVLGTVVPAAAAQASVSAPVATAASASADPAQAGIAKSTLVGFTPGNIISDAVFTNKNTMTEAQIQAFFNSKVARCQGGRDENNEPIVCLKDFRMNTVTRPADAYCSGYTGAANESAARIIYRVSQACNINPQVLIVMLQKEQSLVNHTWPSAWRYRIALGQGCPDTAPCDPKFIGFFHQIYGAARQMQIYMEGKWFQWYAPGKTWNILYHWDPKRGCGSAPVYVANKATSALYYYTPYQPNAAAMRGGDGDYCSSFGNRNFYNFFTDWFGSTQTTTASQGLVKVGSDVWLLSGKNRFHVTAAAYPEYRAALGDPAVVGAAVLNNYAVGAMGSLYVKNASTGTVAMLQGGQTHRFASCDMVAQWGGACGAPLVVLTDALFTRFSVGTAMTTFGRLTAGGRIHQIADQRLVPVFDAKTAAGLNGGTAPYAAVFPAALVASRTVDPKVRFLPATFVKASGAPEVWLADDSGVLRHLPSWAQAAELGLPSTVGSVVPAADIAAYKRSGSLTSFVQCGATTYVAAGGKLSALKGAVPAGFTAMTYDAATCAKLNLKGPNMTGPAVFVQFAGTATVYQMSAGQYRPVDSAADRTAINGGVAPTILVAAAAYKNVVQIGVTPPKSGTFARVAGTSEVWLVDGSSLVHLPSWAMAAEYGLPASDVLVDAAVVAGMERRPSLTPFAVCGNTTYIAAGGKLRAVSAAQVGGNPTTALSAQTCAGRTEGTVVEAPVFLSDGSRTVVAIGGGFLGLPDAASIARAAAGAPQTINRVAPAYLDRLPAAQVPVEGALARASNESEVTLLSGGVRLRLPNWGIAADMGVQARYQIVAPAALAPRPQGGPNLSIFVQCGSVSYVASQGALYPVAPAALGGFTPTPLSAAACATLPLSKNGALTSVQLTSAGGPTYALKGGKLVAVTAPGTGPTLPVDARTIAGLPKG